MRFIWLIIFLPLIIVSCEKEEIEYQTTSVSDVAEFQLHYFVPVTNSTENYIYRVEINDVLYANSTAPLKPYSAIPNGSVGRFYTVSAGTVNLKLYKGPEEELVYNKDVNLDVKKQNIFVYDLDKEPIVFDNEYPYVSNITEDSDSTCYVKFYNFLFETNSEPTDLKLQYQYEDSRTGDFVNIGEPVGFGETTGWQPVKVIKSIYNSSGYQRIDYKIKVIDDSGEIIGDLQLLNTNDEMVDYSDYWTGYIGRRYHHILGGVRTETPVASVSQFTAL